jgi:hypothetical protein
MDTEQQIFWTSFYTFAGGFVLALFAIAYKSKCDKVNLCWGMIDIHRAVDIELQEDVGSRVSPLRDDETKVET